MILLLTKIALISLFMKHNRTSNYEINLILNTFALALLYIFRYMCSMTVYMYMYMSNGHFPSWLNDSENSSLRIETRWGIRHIILIGHYEFSLYTV